MPKLCLNMIVKNEAARIKRCLVSVADYVDCYVIVDTGSTDGTPALIKAFFDERRIPGEIHDVKFKNFEQARNAALRVARASPLSYDYLLLVDADMELAVADKTFRDHLSAVSYDVSQRSGTISYLNRRLVRRDQTGLYRGVTHEYLDIPSGGPLDTIWFVDHADGANRKDKFKRDILLLLTALKKEPNNGRYYFYLGQSYRDAGRHKEAAQAYKKRAEMSGWDEETWNARVNYAHCLKALGDEGGFLREMLVAYNLRPSRAEALHDIAHFYRMKGQNHASLLFSEAGMTIPKPKDHLFVSDFVYAAGFREEFSICAFYDPKKRDRGFAACNQLALDRNISHDTRELARSNLFHYLPTLRQLAPSFFPKEILFSPSDGYHPMNPSVACVQDRIYTTVRCVNYTISDSGHYNIFGKGGDITDANPIHTRTYLLELDRVSNDVLSSHEILPPLGMPEPAYKLVLGFEDMRLFYWRDALWCSACIREMNASGWCEQIMARVSHSAVPGAWRLDQERRMIPDKREHEKNWMPQVLNGTLQFIYRLGKIVNTEGKLVQDQPPSLAAEHMSGGTQVIPFRSGWLALVHEARIRPDNKQRYYQHRFVWFDMGNVMRRVSLPFVFHDKQIEFASGLALHPDGKKLLISYGVRDSAAWLATVDAQEVAELIHE